MASRHTGPAIRHQLGRRTALQLRRKTLLELIGRQETPVAAQIIGERRTLSAGDVPGNRIDRFHFALEARQGAGIEQRQRGLAEAFLQLFCAEQQRTVRAPAKGAARDGRRIQTQRQPCAVPGFEPTIEDEHALTLAQPGQQPPGPRRVGSRTVVIQNHFAVGIDAPGLQTLDQGGRLRQWMTPGHTLDHFAAEIALEIGEARPGNVPFGIATLTVIRVFEGKTTIQNHQPRLVLLQVQRLRADQLRNGHNGLL